jgi:hypothetical protein
VTHRAGSADTPAELARGDDDMASGVRSRVELSQARELQELYIRLLCMFARDQVLPFLMAHDNYRLEFCLDLCEVRRRPSSSGERF